MLKNQTGVTASLKRTFRYESVPQAKILESDEWDCRVDYAFLTHVFSLHVSQVEAQLGVANPQLDKIFRLKRPRFPDAEIPVLGNDASALIDVALGLKRAFFVVKTNGSGSKQPKINLSALERP